MLVGCIITKTSAVQNDINMIYYQTPDLLKSHALKSHELNYVCTSTKVISLRELSSCECIWV